MKKIVFILFLLSTIFAFGATGIGTAPSYNEEIKVKVELDNDNKIISIEVISTEDTKRIAMPAINQLTKEIIETQNLELDNIAGATYTSLGFKNAVKDAIKNAK